MREYTILAIASVVGTLLVELFWLRTGFYFAMGSAGLTPSLAGGG